MGLGSISRCGGGKATRFSGVFGTNAPPTIANGGSARLPFNVQAQGDAVLDITLAIEPTVLATGYWDLNVNVFITSVAFTVGGSFEVYLEGDDTAGFGYQARQTSPPATAGLTHPQVQIVLAGVWLTLGSPIYVVLINNDGAAARDFAIGAALVSLVAAG